MFFNNNDDWLSDMWDNFTGLFNTEESQNKTPVHYKNIKK